MTEKRFSVRFSAEGGDRIQAELVGIGEAGSRSLHEIDQSALEVEAALARMAQQAGQSRTVLRGIGDTRVALSNVTVEQAKSARASAEVFQETERLRASYNSLRGSLDPLHAATVQYEQAQEELAEAVRRGVVPQTEARQVQALLQQEYRQTVAGLQAATRGVDGLGRSAGQRQMAMRNMAFQLNQIGQQGAVTGNYLGALAIQLPDMLTSFGLLGIMIGGVAAVMGPMVVEWIRGADAGRTLNDVVEDLEASMSALESAGSRAARPIEDLIGQYGRFVGRAREVLLVQRQLAYLDSAQALTEVTDSLTDLFGRLEMLGDTSAAADWLGPIVERFGQLNPNAVNELAQSLDIAEDQAILLTQQFVALRDARGPEAQAAALRNVIEQFELATGGAFEMSEGAREIYRQLLNAEETALRLVAIDMASGISDAADQAERFSSAMLLAREASRRSGPYEPDPTVLGFRPEDPRSQANTWQIWTGTTHVGPPTISRPERPQSSGGGSSPEEVSAAYRMAAESIRQAEQASVTFAMVQAELNEMLREGEINGVQYASALEIARERLTEAGQASEFWESQSRSVIDAIAAGESLAEVWDSVAQSIRRAVIELILFNEGPFAVQGGFSGLFNAFSGSLFGGGSGGSVKPFATGGVVNGPTYFPMSGGHGVMGEAGPEAIMPLERVGGKLGVRAAGGGGAVVMKTEIHNHVPGAQVTEEESTGPDGERIKRFHVNMHRRMLAEGEFDGVMRGKYGAETRTVRR